VSTASNGLERLRQDHNTRMQAITDAIDRTMAVAARAPKNSLPGDLVLSISRLGTLAAAELRRQERDALAALKGQDAPDDRDDDAS